MRNSAVVERGPETSYPFLRVALVHDANYGDVLHYADLCDREYVSRPATYAQIAACDRLPYVAKRDVLAALVRESERRRTPQ